MAGYFEGGAPQPVIQPAASTNSSNSTTGSVSAIVGTLLIPPGVHVLEIYLTASDGGTGAAAWKLTQAAMSDGVSAVTLLGTAVTVLANVGSLLLGAAPSLSVSGASVNVNGTGVLAKSLSWFARIDVVV